jgi:hypothetical protein
MRPILLGVLLLPAALGAADQPRPGIVVNPATDVVLPQLVDGAAWKTTIFLASLDPTESLFWHLAFYADNGFPMSIPIQGAGPTPRLFASLPPNWSVTIETQGTSAALLQGWAVLSMFDRSPDLPGARQVTSRVAGMAVFRQRIEGRPDFEAVVPFGPMNETRFVMPFDNRNDFSTGIAWLNPNLATPAPVEVTIFTADARTLRQDSFTLAPGSKLVFAMPDRYPESRGQGGTILVRTSGRSLAGLGLRFNPTGAFTSFHTLSATP